MSCDIKSYILWHHRSQPLMSQVTLAGSITSLWTPVDRQPRHQPVSCSGPWTVVPVGPLCRCLVRAEGPVLDPMLSWGGCSLEGDMPTGEPRVPPPHRTSIVLEGGR